MWSNTNRFHDCDDDLMMIAITRTILMIAETRAKSATLIVIAAAAAAAKSKKIKRFPFVVFCDSS